MTYEDDAHNCAGLCPRWQHSGTSGTKGTPSKNAGSTGTTMVGTACRGVHNIRAHKELHSPIEGPDGMEKKASKQGLIDFLNPHALCEEQDGASGGGW